MSGEEFINLILFAAGVVFGGFVILGVGADVWVWWEERRSRKHRGARKDHKLFMEQERRSCRHI